MSLSALKSISNLTKILPSSRFLFPYNSVSKSLFRAGEITQNTRTITRSLFYFCRSRDSSDSGRPFASKVTFTNRCGCGCGLHTKGDQELAAFLAEEIENEKKLQMSPELPQLEGFECKLEGAEVTLTKRIDHETIVIKSNVNNSVDADDSVIDPNDTKEPQEGEMKAKPEFTVEIQKGKKTLSFQCSYVTAMPDEEPNEAYSDSFQIVEVSLYIGEFEDSTYSVSGDIMDGYLYDLLMNYLQERGISNEFADKMIAFFTSYEHKLYVNLLQGLKNFVEK